MMRLTTSLLLAMTLAGCFTTRVEAQAIAMNRSCEYSNEIWNHEMVHEARQYFAVGGLVPLSKPAGRHCKHGVSYVESEVGGIDFLVSAGMGFVGVVVGMVGCAIVSGFIEMSPESAFWCRNATTPLAASALSSRTTRYVCAAPRRSHGDDVRVEGTDWWY